MLSTSSCCWRPIDFDGKRVSKMQKNAFSLLSREHGELTDLAEFRESSVESLELRYPLEPNFDAIHHLGLREALYTSNEGVAVLQ